MNNESIEKMVDYIFQNSVNVEPVSIRKALEKFENEIRKNQDEKLRNAIKKSLNEATEPGERVPMSYPLGIIRDTKSL